MKHLPIRFLNVLVVLLPGAASAGTGLTAPKRSDLSSAQELATSRGSFVEATDSLIPAPAPTQPGPTAVAGPQIPLCQR